MSNKLTKQEAGLLQIYADNLPVIFDGSHEAHMMTGAEIKEMGFVTDQQIADDDKKEYCQPVMVARNHFRRLRTAWFTGGEEALKAYMNEVVEIWKRNFELEGEFKIKPFREGKVIMLWGGPANAVEIKFIDNNGDPWTTIEPIDGDKEEAIKRGKERIRQKFMDTVLRLQHIKLCKEIETKLHAQIRN